MLIQVELYTRTYEAALEIDGDNNTTLTLTPNSQLRLEEYLRVVLPTYILMPEGDLTFTDLMRLANQWQKNNPGEKLSEPQVHLPYFIPIETKNNLQELATAQGISMAQLLVRLIDKAYDKVVINNEKLK